MGREYEIIEWISARCTPSPSLLLGIGDDAAVIQPDPNSQLLVTTDTLVEGVHFTIKDRGKRGQRGLYGAEDLGIKAAVANLSDIGAMGGRPRWAFLNLAVPKDVGIAFTKAVVDGLARSLQEYGCIVAGGDTVASPGPMMISVTIVGETGGRGWLSRSGARPGDLILCSGWLGESAAGLHIFSEGYSSTPPLPRRVRMHLISRHLRPTPRVDLGRALLEARAASSCIDVSDGPATDVAHICRQSGVKAILDCASLPISRALKMAGRFWGISPLEWCLGGGEDFELIWTVPKERLGVSIATATRILGRRPFIIGTIEEGEGVFLSTSRGTKEVTLQGYEHG